MLVVPKIRGFICTTTHPLGCQKKIEQQIDIVRSQGVIPSNFKKILILGGSTGFGLASRIVCGFGWRAATLNVSLERPYGEKKLASPGWYQTAHYEKLAQAEGLYAKSIIGDAFTNEIKKKTIEKIKSELGSIDLLIYSLAAPRRTDPLDEKVYQSFLKPIGATDRKKSLDTSKIKIDQIEIGPASDEEINATVKVMGGEDWELWIDILKENQLLASHFHTLAYSYIGPGITQSIYRKGTIGRAKEHLEATALKITDTIRPLGGNAYISINKALVTQASSAIPILPLYISLLYQVMKEEGCHEGCLEQMNRLFREKIKMNSTEETLFELDQNRFIRLDDWEMKPSVQEEVKKRWEKVDDSNLDQLGDFKGYQKDFLQLFGFEIEEVDYSKEINPSDYQIQLN